MSKCPKCGRKLHLYNLGAYCPDCGTNLIMYGFEETFYREAKMAELSNSVWSVRVRNLKYSLIGSKWTILRLVAAVLTLAAFLVPAVNVTLKIAQLYENAFPLSGLGLFGAFSDGSLLYCLSMADNALDPSGFAALRTLLFAYAFCAVLAVLVLLTSILCFISHKNMQKITACIAAAGAVGCVVTFILALVFVSAAKKDLFFDASLSFGLFVNLAAFAFAFVVCRHLWKHGIAVEYPEGAVERAEIYRKVKKGEINIDDLPQPVVETAETRKIHEEIEKAEQGLLEAAYASGVKANEIAFGSGDGETAEAVPEEPADEPADESAEEPAANGEEGDHGEG